LRINYNKIETNFQFEIFDLKNIDINRIEMFNKKLIKIYKFSEDHILYYNEMFNNPGNKIKFGLYNDEMKPEDIISGNDKYFTEYKDNFITLEKDKINIIYMNHPNFDQFHYMLRRKNNSQSISINDKDTNILYLQKDKEYILDFQNNTLNRMIKLSKKTNNSEIIIKEENIILNSKNLYYQIKDDFKGKIKLEVIKTDAIIEFLFKMPNIEVLDYEQLNANSSKKYFLIKFSKKYSGKNVQVNLKSNINYIVSFKFFIGYSKPPYSYYYNTQENLNTFNSNDNTYALTFPIPIEKDLMEDEYFCVLIESLISGNLEIFYHSNNKKQDDNKGFKTWIVILIISASIIVLFIIIIILVCCCTKKNQISNKEIENKMEKLNEINDI